MSRPKVRTDFVPPQFTKFHFRMELTKKQMYRALALQGQVSEADFYKALQGDFMSPETVKRITTAMYQYAKKNKFADAEEFRP
jgi:hypothetical protein